MCRICGCTNAARPPRGAAGEDTSTKQEAVNASIAIGADVVRIYATSAVTLTVVRARTTGHKRAVGSHRAVRRAREIGRASEREERDRERESVQRVTNANGGDLPNLCRTRDVPTSLHADHADRGVSRAACSARSLVPAPASRPLILPCSLHVNAARGGPRGPRSLCFVGRWGEILCSPSQPRRPTRFSSPSTRF